MQNDSNGFNIKVTNHLNGEIIEKHIVGADQAVGILNELSASKRAIETAMDNIKAYIDIWLGQDDQAEAGGKMVRRVQRERRTWNIQALKEIGLDADAIEVISTINMSAAKTLVDELIERGDVKPDAKKRLNETADVTVTKPYLEIR